MDQPQGNGAPQAPQGDAPSSVTEEKVAEIVNRAISARNKMFQDQIGKQLDGVTKSIQENLKGLTEQFAAGSATKDGKKGKKEGEEGADESPVLKSLQRQLADLKADNERIAQSAAAEKAKNRDSSLRQKLAESLGEMGLKDAVRVKHAIHHLVDGEKRVSYGEEGEAIVFRDSDDSVLDLATGLKSWMKSEDGKYFLPPTGARGSGDGRGGNAPPPKGTVDQSAVWAGLADKLFG
jgi:hypothetical protein